MPEYESSTHMTKSDRIIIYGIFLTMVILTIMLYRMGIDGFSRLSLYATIVAFFFASWAWIAGHYSKKHKRHYAEHANCVPATALRVVANPPESYYIHKGEATPLGDALGVKI